MTAEQWFSGIIPALAGNTTWPGTWTIGRKDHPRSRGEYRLVENTALAKSGSSPLSRGILGGGQPSLVAVGIIPALAGNTDRPKGPDRYKWDHPRSRGEYSGAGSRPWWR